MNNIINFDKNQLTMSSREIAELTEKKHQHVKRDIRNMLEQVGKGVSKFGRTYLDSQSKEQEEYNLPQNLTITLVSGYRADLRLRIVDRWIELEGKQTPEVKDPLISATVLALTQIDQVKQEQAKLAEKTEILESRMQNVELQHRNGVPEGYLSRKQAHNMYGLELSWDVFHLALAAFEVPQKPYIHRCESGDDVPTYAYKDSDIGEAIELFLEDAQQASPKTCQSPILKGKRFRYVKDKAA